MCPEGALPSNPGPVEYVTVPILLVIALGGALGALGRFGLEEAFPEFVPGGWPWGTLLANLIGSFAIGLIATSPRVDDGPAWLRPFLITGVLGGFTTFSAFALELGVMLDAGRILAAAGYLLITLLGGLSAVHIALWFRGRFAGTPVEDGGRP